MPAWNKNVHVDDGALGGAEDVSEAEADLVPVPRAQGRRGDSGHTIDVLDEPDDEGGVEQADERSDAQDGFLLSRLRVGEAEQLLAFPEKDLDAPAARVGFHHGADFERGIEAEEDAVGHDDRVGGDDDDAQQASAGGAVPLGADRLETHGGLARSEEHTSELQ